LGDRAAEPLQSAQGDLIFDSLGDQVGSEAVRQRNRGPHNGHRSGVVSHSRHEYFVEFQLVDRDILQACQRRPPGAVVVQRDANAEAPQLGHCVTRPHRVDEGAFGDLDDECVRRQTLGKQHSFDVAHQFEVEQVRRGEVHRDGRGDAAFAP
jgi:hypothetical protein